jgi:hypothetical protein
MTAPPKAIITLPTKPERKQDSLLTILIGGEPFEKPFLASCPVCQSPWMLQVDHWLAAGYPFSDIQDRLKARRARVPADAQLRAHIPHLAPPHQAARERLAAAGSLDAPDGGSLSALNRMLLQRATEALAAGEEAMRPSMRDLLRALQLQLKIEEWEEHRGHATDEEWRAAFTEFFGLARQHLGDRFSGFLRDVYASQAISAMTGRPASPAVLQASAQGPEAVPPSALPPENDEIASTR